MSGQAAAVGPGGDAADGEDAGECRSLEANGVVLHQAAETIATADHKHAVDGWQALPTARMAALRPGLSPPPVRISTYVLILGHLLGRNEARSAGGLVHGWRVPLVSFYANRRLGANPRRERARRPSPC